MTDQQKYAEVLKELGALLADKNATISCQKWQIEQLKEKLAAAEKELADAQLHIIEIANEREVMAAEYEAKLKGGAA